MLKPAGYVSGIFGKWDLGVHRRYLPLAALLKGKQILEDLQSKTYMALVYALAGEFYAEVEDFDSAAKFLREASRMYRQIDMPVEEERAMALMDGLPESKQ